LRKVERGLKYTDARRKTTRSKTPSGESLGTKEEQTDHSKTNENSSRRFNTSEKTPISKKGSNRQELPAHRRKAANGTRKRGNIPVSGKIITVGTSSHTRKKAEMTAVQGRKFPQLLERKTSHKCKERREGRDETASPWRDKPNA